jgi:hypothetical protein
MEPVLMQQAHAVLIIHSDDGCAARVMHDLKVGAIAVR